MMKRIVSVLLVIAVSAGILSGCVIKSNRPGSDLTANEPSYEPTSDFIDSSTEETGDNNHNPKKADKEKNKENEKNPDDPKNPNKEKEPPVDIDDPVPNEGFIKGADENVLKNKSVRFYVAETWGHPSNNRYQLYPQLYKKYKLSIEAKPSTFLRDTLQNITEIKGGKQIDLIGTGHEKLPSVFSICKPLNSYIDLSKCPDEIDKSLIIDMKKGDDIMFLPLNGGKEGIIYNANSIRNYSLEDPYDLYKKGQWTWDTFKKYVEKMSIQNSSGVNTTWGFGCWPRTLHEFALSNNSGYYSYNADGSVTSNINTEAVKDSISYIQDIYGKKKTFYFFQSLGNYEEFYHDETVAMLKMGYVHNPKNLNLGMVPMPKGPNAGSENVVTSMGIGYGLPKQMNKKGNELTALKFLETMLVFQSQDEKREFKMCFEANPRWEQQYNDVFIKAPTKMLILYGVGQIEKSLTEIENAMTDTTKTVSTVTGKMASIFEREAKKVYTIGQ